MKAALRWLASNSPLMVLALILASLAWVVATEEEDPAIQERYAQPIPVTLPALPEGMVIVGEFDERVQVTVRAPTSVFKTLTVDDFSATIDLAGLTAGVHQVPVQVTLDKQPAQVVLVEPDHVALELEPRAERSVPVRVQIEGKPTLGYLMRAPIIDPREVTVSGPGTYVTQVVEAVTLISVQDANADVKGDFPLQPQDSEGQPVPYVTLMPDVVDVHILIEPSGYYRPLAVKVVLEGQVAPGYRITNISVEPPTVTVFGAPNVIDALPGYIETEPIDVEGAQADVIKRPAALSIPQNVALVSGQQVEVKVSIEAIQSSRTVEIVPELQGLEPGLTATVSPETVEVILGGPVPLLETLETDDVRVILDLFGLLPGTHQIEPQVVVPEGVTAQSINPATIQVEIFVAPTPTPTKP